MSRWIRLGLVIALFSIALLNTTMHSARAASWLDYEPDQIVVRLAALAGGDILGINQTYGTSTLASLFNHDDIFLLGTPPGADVETLVQVMASDLRLVYAELNHINSTPEDGSTDRIYGWGGQDPTPFRNQNSAAQLHLETAHAYSRGQGALIAVLDSGVQLDHPAFADSLSLLGFDFVDNDPAPADEANGVDDDGDGQVDEGYGHGTHVAGIVHLVAPDASIMPVRVLNSDGRGNNFKTASAILYAAYNGADVINLSLGAASQSLLLRDTVTEAAQAGAVVVAAAGNLNSAAPQYPAAEACALAVTSVNDKDRKSTFANYGDWIGVAAYGESIYSAFPASGYARASGTSVSTPFVAGQAALLRSVNPDLTLDELGRLIGGTAYSLDRRNPAYRGLLGAGRIDVVASLKAQAAGAQPASGHALFAGCGD
ncbi:MAG TPA: S8 family serine peptidase [Anaerolineae bacterium]|nr:S8 family serine peptidase [Anaerolineae bacterium]